MKTDNQRNCVKKWMIDKLSNITLYDAQVLIVYIAIFFYLITYFFAFEIFDTYSRRNEWSEGISEYMNISVIYMGKAFSIAFVTLWILQIRNKIIGCIVVLINIVIQCLYLGKNLIDTNHLFTHELSKSDKLSVEYCNDIMACIIYIGVVLIMLAIVTIYIILSIKEKSLPKVVKKKKESKKKKLYIILLQLMNFFVIVALWCVNIRYALLTSGASLTELIEGTELFVRVWFEDGFWGLVLPFSLMLIIIVDKLINKEFFISIIGCYLVFLMTIKNIIYHIFSFYIFHEGKVWDGIYNDYRKVIVSIIGIYLIMAIWKYIVSPFFQLRYTKGS